MNKFWVVAEKSLDPVHNLALEYALLQAVRPNEIILYLWQNENTVVIGRNQNAYQECNLAALKQVHGHLVRRMSGGGAVYHDLGNLNFTFLMHKENEDIPKQTQIIVDALKLCGIEASVSGRNDLLVNQRKCSGHAYFTQKNKAYHHGTLLVDVDQAMMQQILKPAPAKLKSKGVDSIRSRTVNLVEVNPSLSITSLKQALIQASSDYYQLEPLEYSNQLELEVLIKKFSSDQWIYQENHPFAITKQKYCSFGMLELELDVIKNVIEEVHVYTDCMDLNLVEKLKHVLIGVPYHLEKIKEALGVELAEVYSLWNEEEL